MFTKLSWGAKIAILYCGFIALITVLVVSSYHQHFDLVSTSYYDDEIAYQKVIDAENNDVKLSSPIVVAKEDNNIKIQFPKELGNAPLKGNVVFYSPVNSKWDRTFPISAKNDIMYVALNKLEDTRYTIKVELIAGNKNYYQESEMNLYK